VPRGIHTVLFDLDGTLTVPVLDFARMREAIGLAPGLPIVATLEAMPGAEAAWRWREVERLELEAAALAVAAPGALELFEELGRARVRVGIVTRNHRKAAEITLGRIGLACETLVARDCVARPKPAPDPALEALRRLGREVAGSLMVGDYIDDILCGRAAGMATCFVANGGPLRHEVADINVADLHELREHFRAHGALDIVPRA
jgi:HAD superfamily hydrolase (TIGR01549 family)